jgi:hypothetical protein
MWQDSLAIDGKNVTDKLKMPQLKLDLGPSGPPPASSAPARESADRPAFNPLLD